jgi:hypothetical protein
MLARGREQVQGADGVDVEVVVGDVGGAVVRRLRGGVDDRAGAQFLEQFLNARAVADVELVVDEAGEGLLEAALVPAGVAGGAEKRGALVVVEAVDVVAEVGEKDADFGTDQAG